VFFPGQCCGELGVPHQFLYQSFPVNSWSVASRAGPDLRLFFLFTDSLGGWAAEWNSGTGWCLCADWGNNSFCHPARHGTAHSVGAWRDFWFYINQTGGCQLITRHRPHRNLGDNQYLPWLSLLVIALIRLGGTIGGLQAIEFFLMLGLPVRSSSTASFDF